MIFWKILLKHWFSKISRLWVFLMLFLFFQQSKPWFSYKKFFKIKCVPNRLSVTQRGTTSDPNLSLRNVDWDFSLNQENEETFKSKLLSIAEEEDLTYQLLHSLFFDDNFTGKSVFLGQWKGWGGELHGNFDVFFVYHINLSNEPHGIVDFVCLT